MKPNAWIALGLALALAPGLGRVAGAAETTPPALGVGPAYEALGTLPVMHAGRIKPIDTLARQEVRQVFGRETVKLLDAENEVVARWGPIGSLYDWAVRPDFWDDQPIILVDYQPLKRLILAEAIQADLTGIAGHETTPAAARAELKRLAADPELSALALQRFAATAGLAKADEAIVRGLAAKLSEEHKWLSPAELEDAQVTVNGTRKPFETFFREAFDRQRMAQQDTTGKTRLSEVEKRAIEVGKRLVNYQAISRREVRRSTEPLLAMPRPSNAEYLAFVAGVVKKVRHEEDTEHLSLLELDALKSLDTYWNDIQLKDRAVPGTSSKFDEKFAAWLRDSSAWVPLRVILDSKAEDLAAAGFPADKSAAFLNAFGALDAAEKSEPGKVDPAKATAVVASARALGDAVNPDRYPRPRAIERETFFNEFSPFFWAQWVYFAALLPLAVALAFGVGRGQGQRTTLGGFGRAMYGLGMLGLVGGIALEVVGFSLRILITGWAPVTNMYETVIWVALVTAVLGLVFELIFRRVFAALAGTMVAVLGTVLAANVPLLDPSIHALQPVLRSNYWLTIHVLTEVSSYGAFALAMGLGLIATFYYLTATYRNSPDFFRLALPLVPGLPLLAAGVFGLMVSSGSFGYRVAPENVLSLSYAASSLVGLGGFLSIVGAGALAGESISRASFRARLNAESALEETELAGDADVAEPAATAVQTVTIGEANGPVATLTRPSIAEIRSMAARRRPKLDARGRAMQDTAAQVKPLSNIIYRTMQVGVLLIAAGTMLGGFWADVSWGRFWGWDPKEVWALITLLIYLIPLHGRFAGWVNTFGLVMASVACFTSVVMAWYGVNFVLGVGLHSYGFTEGGSQGVVSAVVLAVIAVAGAAFWRRMLASGPPAASAA